MTSRVFTAAALGISLITMSGFGSCGRSIESVCSAELPDFSAKVEGAKLSILAWGSNPDPDRAPASLDEFKFIELSEKDRKSWQGWAEERLKETQHYMDDVEDSSTAPKFKEIRARLNELADTLVVFHGYVSQGKIHLMIQTLEKVQARTQKVQDLACRT